MTKSSRGRMPAILAAGVLLLVAACSTRQDVMLGSMLGLHDMEPVGQKYHAQILAEFGGAYDDPALQQYVNTVAEVVHRRNELSGNPPIVTVLNSPVASVMSAPVGRIYVTRGLLALINNEAELAGLITAEMQHIRAGDTNRRYRRTDTMGAALMENLVPGSDVANLAQYADAPYLLRYTAVQTADADEEAIDLLAEAGYDPNVMVALARNIEADSALAARIVHQMGGADPYHFITLHPRSPDALIKSINEAQPLPPTAREIGQARYLQMLNHMLMDDDPALGYVDNGTYMHPGANFMFVAPPGFRLVAGPGVVIGRGPSGSMMAFDVITSPRLHNLLIYLRDDLARVLPMRDLEHIEINGWKGAMGRASVGTRQGPVDLRIAVVRIDGGRLVRFLVVTPKSLTDKLSLELRRSVESLTTITASAATVGREHRMRVVQTAVGQTVDTLSKGLPYGAYNRDRFLVLNGIAPGEGIQPGFQVKVVEAVQ